jgi:hypothetical protein
VSCTSSDTCDGFGKCGGSAPADHWAPAADSDTDKSGTQKSQTLSVPIKVEVKQYGAGLQFRVCKPGDKFTSDIAFSIYDGATNTMSGLAPAKLATKGKSCSPWYVLPLAGKYTEGEVFGGIWRVVSPATSSSGWPAFGACGVSGSPSGTCWSGIDITLTRTCKP